MLSAQQHAMNVTVQAWPTVAESSATWEMFETTRDAIVFAQVILNFLHFLLHPSSWLSFC